MVISCFSCLSHLLVHHVKVCRTQQTIIDSSLLVMLCCLVLNRCCCMICSKWSNVAKMKYLLFGLQLGKSIIIFVHQAQPWSLRRTTFRSHRLLALPINQFFTVVSVAIVIFSIIKPVFHKLSHLSPLQWPKWHHFEGPLGNHRVNSITIVHTISWARIKRLELILKKVTITETCLRRHPPCQCIRIARPLGIIFLWCQLLKWEFLALPWVAKSLSRWWWSVSTPMGPRKHPPFPHRRALVQFLMRESAAVTRQRG